MKHDARKLPFKGDFDFAIMLCGGGFCLMETDEMNFEIVNNPGMNRLSRNQKMNKDKKQVFCELFDDL